MQEVLGPRSNLTCSRDCFGPLRPEWALPRNPCECGPFHPFSSSRGTRRFGVDRSNPSERLLQAMRTDSGLRNDGGFLPTVTGAVRGPARNDVGHGPRPDAGRRMVEAFEGGVGACQRVNRRSRNYDWGDVALRHHHSPPRARRSERSLAVPRTRGTRGWHGVRSRASAGRADRAAQDSEGRGGDRRAEEDVPPRHSRSRVSWHRQEPSKFFDALSHILGLEAWPKRGRVAPGAARSGEMVRG